MPVDKVKVGVVGCGAISGIYLERMCRTFSGILEVIACADLLPEKAAAKAQQYPSVTAMPVDELLSHPDVEIVVNLTVPKAHAEVATAALEAGKSVYNEKPLAVSRQEGRRLLALAKRKRVLIGCAPDTFMGAGHQTCRKLLDDGAIGEPVAAVAFVLCHGHESWHPNPEFYYERGGGPMFDMGPYYLTALVNLLGPVKRVTGAACITSPTRTITSEPKRGKVVKVEVPTHTAGVLDFGRGAIGNIITSFDVWAHTLPHIQLYGTEGSMSVPDPNGFGGAVQIRRAGDEQWTEAVHTHAYAENFRGIGIADMAYALRHGRPHRASGALAFHVLDIMQAIHEASEKGRHVRLENTCERPAAVPTGLPEGALDT